MFFCFLLFTTKKNISLFVFWENLQRTNLLAVLSYLYLQQSFFSEQYALILSAGLLTGHFSSFKLHYWGHTTNRCACKPDTVQADQGKICKFASEQRVIPPTVLISKFLFFVALLKPCQSTGKSLSETLIFAEHGEKLLCTEIVLNVKNDFCTQHTPCSELGIFMYWTCN